MVGRRIRAYRKKKGLTVKQLAEIIGISQGSLSDIENEKTKPSAKTITSLVRNTDINPTWLLTGQGEMFKKPVKELPIEPMTAQEILQKFPEVKPVKAVPVINIQVPAGFPELPLSQEQIIDYLYLPDIPKGSIAIKVKGNSMEPTIEDGEYVVFLPINKLMESIKSGDIIIVRNEWNELILKRYREKNGKIYLTSDNPKYPTIEVNEHYKIVGKAICAVKEKKF